MFLKVRLTGKTLVPGGPKGLKTNKNIKLTEEGGLKPGIAIESSIARSSTKKGSCHISTAPNNSYITVGIIRNFLLKQHYFILYQL